MFLDPTIKKRVTQPQFDLIHKSHNAPVLYPSMYHSEQKCVHFCSEWCIVGYGTCIVGFVRLVLYLVSLISNRQSYCHNTRTVKQSNLGIVGHTFFVFFIAKYSGDKTINLHTPYSQNKTIYIIHHALYSISFYEHSGHGDVIITSL